MNLRESLQGIFGGRKEGAETRTAVPAKETGKRIGQVFYQESIGRLGKMMERLDKEGETIKAGGFKDEVKALRGFLDKYRREEMDFDQATQGSKSKIGSAEVESKLQHLKTRRGEIDRSIRELENRMHLSLNTEIVTELPEEIEEVEGQRSSEGGVRNIRSGKTTEMGGEAEEERDAA